MNIVSTSAVVRAEYKKEDFTPVRIRERILASNKKEGWHVAILVEKEGVMPAPSKNLFIDYRVRETKI